MKKFAILALAALLVVSFTVPASALENIFGGYWRTRMYRQINFAGDDSAALEESKDNVVVDTRTRLYYTAKLNDNLKFVNKFEFDTTWGDNINSSSYGDVGTDGIAVEVKNSYADFNIGAVNVLVGAQPFTLARGFISDEDAAGIKVIWKVNDGLYLPFIWEHLNEGYLQNSALSAYTKDKNRLDVDALIFAPIIMLSKDIKINPYYVLLHAQDGLYFSTVAPAYSAGTFNNINAHIFGLDFDGKFGAASLWFTGIMQKGSSQLRATGVDVDMEGYLVALGGKFDLGTADIHGQAFLASGEDKGLTDKEVNAFITTSSTYYYWAEILGRGIFDNQDPVGSTGFRVSNVQAVNVGATVKPMDKLKIAADLWWVKLAEDNAFGEDELGIEADVVVSYKLVEGLTLDIVGAYLFAGDALSADGKNENDPYEVGTRLSLSF